VCGNPSFYSQDRETLRGVPRSSALEERFSNTSREIARKKGRLGKRSKVISMESERFYSREGQKVRHGLYSASRPSAGGTQAGGEANFVSRKWRKKGAGPSRAATEKRNTRSVSGENRGCRKKAAPLSRAKENQDRRCHPSGPALRTPVEKKKNPRRDGKFARTLYDTF